MFISFYGAPLRWLPVRPPSLDVRECNLVELTSESGMSQALVISDLYPAVPSVSRWSVRQCVRAPLVQLFGYVSAIWLSHARCACVVGNRFLYGIRVLVVITLTSREFRVLLMILPTCLRFLRIFGFVGVAWCCVPTFIA